MALPVHDDFNRATEDPLASPWTQVTNSPGLCQLLNATPSYVMSPSGDDSEYYWSTDTPNAAQWAAVTGHEYLQDSYGACVRCSTSARTLYMWVRVSGTTIQLYKRVDGTPSQLGTDVTQSYATDEVLRIEVNDSHQITCYHNGTQKLQTTDSSSPITTGRLGFHNSDMGNHMTLFEGGNLGEAAALSIAYTISGVQIV